MIHLRRPAGTAGAATRDHRLGATCLFRHAVVNDALRGAQPSAPVAVAIAGTRAGAALVVPAAHGLGHLGFQRFLDDLPDRELDQFAPRLALGDALGQQPTELLACPHRGRYSRLHGDASSCRRRQPATLGLWSKQECIPVSLSSKLRTSPRAARLDTNFVGIDDNWLQVECAQRARHIEGRRSGLQSDWCAWWELVLMTQPRKGLRSRGQRPAANDSSGVGSHRAVVPVRRRIVARYGMTPWRESG